MSVTILFDFLALSTSDTGRLYLLLSIEIALCVSDIFLRLQPIPGHFHFCRFIPLPQMPKYKCPNCGGRVDLTKDGDYGHCADCKRRLPASGRYRID